MHRRGFITGLISLVAAPAIVRAGSLMPVKATIEPVYGVGPMMINLDAMMADMLRTMCVPGHFLAPQARKLLTLVVR